jgi:DNA-binding MarR family transcriptional regulator
MSFLDVKVDLRSMPTRANDKRDQLIDAINWESRRSSLFFGLLNRGVASRLGINVTDVEALGVLSVIGLATPTQLATQLGIGTGAATLVIDRLERGGFVRRVRDTKDRRSLTIELVEDRDRDTAALYAPLQRAAAAVLDTYSERDLAVIAEYLARANDVLRAAAQDIATNSP